MSTSTATNVLRYSALGFGIFYGFSHQRVIAANNQASQVQHAFHHQESLIEKARLEWKRKTSPHEVGDASRGIITDPEDKNFDLEAFLKMKAADSS